MQRIIQPFEIIQMLILEVVTPIPRHAAPVMRALILLSRSAAALSTRKEFADRLPAGTSRDARGDTTRGIEVVATKLFIPGTRSDLMEGAALPIRQHMLLTIKNSPLARKFSGSRRYFNPHLVSESDHDHLLQGESTLSTSSGINSQRPSL